jgi:hypothetical protein
VALQHTTTLSRRTSTLLPNLTHLWVVPSLLRHQAEAVCNRLRGARAAAGVGLNFKIEAALKCNTLSKNERLS